VGRAARSAGQRGEVGMIARIQRLPVQIQTVAADVSIIASRLVTKLARFALVPRRASPSIAPAPPIMMMTLRLALCAPCATALAQFGPLTASISNVVSSVPLVFGTTGLTITWLIAE